MFLQSDLKYSNLFFTPILYHVNKCFLKFVRNAFSHIWVFPTKRKSGNASEKQSFWLNNTRGLIFSRIVQFLSLSLCRKEINFITRKRLHFISIEFSHRYFIDLSPKIHLGKIALLSLFAIVIFIQNRLLQGPFSI